LAFKSILAHLAVSSGKRYLSLRAHGAFCGPQYGSTGASSENASDGEGIPFKILTIKHLTKVMYSFAQLLELARVCKAKKPENKVEKASDG
jgi:hypothetical protein